MPRRGASLLALDLFFDLAAQTVEFTQELLERDVSDR